MRSQLNFAHEFSLRTHLKVLVHVDDSTLNKLVPLKQLSSENLNKIIDRILVKQLGFLSLLTFFFGDRGE